MEDRRRSALVGEQRSGTLDDFSSRCIQGEAAKGKNPQFFLPFTCPYSLPG
jgi:hypothetical protein